MEICGTRAGPGRKARGPGPEPAVPGRQHRSRAGAAALGREEFVEGAPCGIPEGLGSGPAPRMSRLEVPRTWG